jgi:hypothetical protein
MSILRIVLWAVVIVLAEAVKWYAAKSILHGVNL